MSQTELGERMGMEGNQAQHWVTTRERGEQPITVDELALVEMALELTPGTLLREVGYLPATISTEDAIRADTKLSPDMRRVVLASYGAAIGVSASPAAKRPTQRKKRRT